MPYHDGEYYHIYNRGAHKSAIFFCDENYRYCLRLLKKYCVRYRVSLMAYCLMPNHYHLILKQEKFGSISRALQTSFNAYTQAINKQQHLSGTLFQGSAKGIHIHSDKYFLDLICYIHRNPVQANIIQRPEQWEFSDYSLWIEEKENIGRNIFFSNGKEYQVFVEQYKERIDQKFFYNLIIDG